MLKTKWMSNSATRTSPELNPSVTRSSTKVTTDLAFAVIIILAILSTGLFPLALVWLLDRLGIDGDNGS